MKTSHAIFAIALTAATLGGAAIAASATDAAAGAANVTAAPMENWLDIPAIYNKVSAAGYSDINEIERGRDGYKIKATSASGERVKLYVDPMSGEVLNTKAKSAKSDQRAPSANADKSPMMDKSYKHRSEQGAQRLNNDAML